MSFDGGGQEGEGVAALLAAGFDHRQHRLDEAAAAGALRPKGELPPNHRMTQRPLARVVRRFDPFVTQRTSTATGDVRTIPGTCRARRRCRFGCRAAASAPPCGGPVPSDAASAAREIVPCAIVGPVLEQLARRMPQTPAKVFRPAVAAVDHRLKIAFQMGPAPLQAAHVPVHLGPIAGDDAVERLAQERRRAPSPRAWHAPRTP